MAQAWRGGIGKYPPNPEGLGNTLPMSLEDSIFLYYSPDDWYWSIPVIWRIAYFFTILQMTGIDQCHSSGEYLFFSILQWQWHRHGSEVLENTLLILRGRAIPPSSVGFASGHRGGYCPTPQDSEGIFQYLLAMPVPLSQYTNLCWRWHQW